MDRRAISVPRLARGRSAQTILDQILVSGSNFITGIILVRSLGLAEFGRFTVAFVILLLANSVQLSFISSPMITLGSLCKTVGERQRFVRGMFGVQLIFCAIASPAALATVVIYLTLDHSGIPAGFLLPFCVSVAFYLMQDWLRRYYFTVGKAATAVWNDSISYVG